LNELAIDAVKDKGSFTSVRGFQGKPQRGIQFTTTWVTAYDCRSDLLDTLRQQVEDGTLTLRVADSVTIGNASEAHARLEAGGTRGRMVIKF
jgi:NADPH:quinone reductase-like Zn-dependent oxidoreductase